eukprot:CAMPEP_0178460100 /NCGR_PEP_ID=MMETSP0689_2-20121128/48498_1 /TAXON_ID=160604 /ORGANISM="Amphidinium massartii, Strain CS-259" /LENGTH=39 /DNA_ID= /DNA_START= /DNA_END= /DNA_ORIENTATION=
MGYWAGGSVSDAVACVNKDDGRRRRTAPWYDTFRFAAGE